MTQVTINGMEMPETMPEQYQCYDEELGEFLVMISGRTVFEVRGTVKVITYYYEYFDDELRKWCLANLKKGSELIVGYLDPAKDPSELQSGRFLCTEPPKPVYYFSVDENAYWTKFSFTLREVEPHD